MSRFLKLSFFGALVLTLALFSSCSDNDDPKPSIDITFENITTTSVDIKWSAVDGAIGYDVEYTEVGENQDLYKSTETTSYNLTALKADTEYEITIVAYEGTSQAMTEFASATKKVKTLAETQP